MISQVCERKWIPKIYDSVNLNLLFIMLPDNTFLYDKTYKQGKIVAWI